MARQRPAVLTAAGAEAAAPSQQDAASRSAPGSRQVMPVWLLPAICGLAGLVSGVYEAGVPTFWRDEAATIDAAQRPVPQILALLHHEDAVNGAYYLLMHPVVVILGGSAAAMRLPSAVGMAVAAAVTAALGRRLARLAGLHAPGLTGLLAGLLLTAVPQVTWYAQDARGYGIVMMLASIATWLLVAAVTDGGWRRWAWYGTAIVFAGMFNAFVLLLLAGHGVTLLLARTEGAAGTLSPRQLGRWGTVSAAAVAALSPLLVAGYQQRSQLAWVPRPHVTTVISLLTAFAGSRPLVGPVTLLAACGAIAGSIPRRRHALTPGTVALPWLTVPAVILLAVSLGHPAFASRYVLYCQPALALLCAAGLSWLGGATGAGLAKLAPDTSWIRPLAWLGPALIVALLAAMLAGPQRTVRLTFSGPRIDNLRRISRILAAEERPGDGVFYFPPERRIIAVAYPAPFRRLTDIAVRTSPVASATLEGTEIGPRALWRRFKTVRRVWLISITYHGLLPAAQTAADRAKIALLRRLHRTRCWHGGRVIACLYTRPGNPGTTG